MENSAFERIRTAFYEAVAAKEQRVILLKSETVNLLLKCTDVQFVHGNLVIKDQDDTIVIGIDSKFQTEPNAYLQTFNGKWTCAAPRVDVDRSEVMTVYL